MGAEDYVHREQIEQPVVDHLARAAAAFLGGLKDEVDGTVEIAMGGQVSGGGQQHGGVTVVAAGVHSAAVHARVREGVVLGHRQCVDVGAQANGTARVAVLDDADHSGLPQAPVHGNAPGGQCAGDQVRGPLLLKPEFGMGMDVAPQRLKGSCLGQDRLEQFHVAGPKPATRAPNTARICESGNGEDPLC